MPEALRAPGAPRPGKLPATHVHPTRAIRAPRPGRIGGGRGSADASGAADPAAAPGAGARTAPGGRRPRTGRSRAGRPLARPVPGQQDARPPQPQQQLRIQIVLSPAGAQMQTCLLRAVRELGALLERAQHLAGQHCGAHLHGPADRLIGGEQPVRVRHRDHAPAGHRPAEPHRARLHRPDLRPLARHADVDPAMARAVRVLGLLERAQHGMRGRHRPLPARLTGVRARRQREQRRQRHAAHEQGRQRAHRRARDGGSGHARHPAPRGADPEAPRPALWTDRAWGGTVRPAP